MTIIDLDDGSQGDASVSAIASGSVIDLDTGEYASDEVVASMPNADILRQQKEDALNRINEDMSPTDAFLVAAGRSLTNIGRAIGVADEEDEATRQAYKGLVEERPISTTLGEALPFMAPGVGIGAIPSLAGRVAAGGALGALEGGIIAEGRDEDISRGATLGGGIGAGVEVLFPVIGRLGRSLFSKVTGKAPRGAMITPDGLPTPELQAALDSQGISFDSLVDEAITEAQWAARGVNPDDVARAARFKSQGIPATTGDITQDFTQQASESRLASMATGEQGAPLRQLRLQQSQAFEGKVNDLVDNLGVPDDMGMAVKDALTGRKKLLKAEKNRLYKEVFEANPAIKDAPILTDNIAQSLPDTDTIEDLMITAPESVEQVKLAMARFGIDSSEDALALLEKRGIEQQPLTAGNFERFRKTLNNIERADQTGAAKVMTGPIKNSLDEEGAFIANAIKDSGADGGEFLETLQKARGVTRQVKTEFSPQAITGRLVDVKRDGVTPVIEASKVIDSILKPTSKIEDLTRTITSLNKAGAKGKKAIGDMQAAVVLRALDDALKAPSRKTVGIETIGGNQFSNSLSKFGDDKLAVLFKGNPKALEQLRGLKQTAKDITPAAAATPKGSAPIIMDLVNRARAVPSITEIARGIEFIFKGGADERAVKAAMKGKPRIQNIAGMLEKDFPQIAASLGISGMVEADDTDYSNLSTEDLIKMAEQ